MWPFDFLDGNAKLLDTRDRRAIPRTTRCLPAAMPALAAGPRACSTTTPPLSVSLTLLLAGQRPDRKPQLAAVTASVRSDVPARSALILQLGELDAGVVTGMLPPDFPASRSFLASWRQ